ncbi:hypothetical protein XHC_0197 [Xanthomonas hortorum pv. carotae str. M081]|nr:hypothetical protein XHC_0197 [Xanthomonas hortorum pv. carotae str. M081]
MACINRSLHSCMPSASDLTTARYLLVVAVSSLHLHVASARVDCIGDHADYATQSKLDC